MTAPHAVEWAVTAPPLEMQSARRWLLWSLESRTRPDGTVQAVKVPRYTTGEKRRGDLNNDAGRLVSYAEAQAAHASGGDRYAGLGFALGEGWQGLDFDKCDQRPELAGLVSGLQSYVEVSPSRTGVHAIGYGAAFDVLGSNASGIEAYCVGRFFTFTGWCLNPGAPLADLAPFVAAELAPRHAAHRKVGAVVARAAIAVPPGDPVLAELADALRFHDPDNRDDWINAGQALVGLGDAGRALWEAWAATSERFPGGDDLERFDTFKGERTGYQSIFAKAQAAGWKNPRKLDPAAIFAGSPYATPGVAVPALAMPAASAPNVTALPVPPPPTVAPVGRFGGEDARGPAGDQRAATLANVFQAIGPGSGLGIVDDTFTGVVLIADRGVLRPFKDTDYGALRIWLERKGFKPPAADTMRDAVAQVAEENKVDSAQAYANGLLWDGVPRIDIMMRDYFGTVDTPYNASVGAYLMTALAGRALVPGIQADKAPILVGEQGAGKSRGVAALAPTPSAFGVVDLSKRDDDLSRQLKGKMILEWAETRGLSSGRGRDIDGLKAWLSKPREEWTPKYKEFVTTYERRCVVVGTSNDIELLDDPTGERRWLPVTVGQINVEALKRDRDQLWAEGVARFRVGGIEWRLAEQLAKQEHATYKRHDEWSERVAAWLESMAAPRLGEVPSPLKNGAEAFSLSTVAIEALGIRIAELRRPEQLQIGKALRALGYEKFTKADSVTSKKLWRKKSDAKGAST